MTLEDQISARLAEVFAAYEEIRRLRTKLTELQQADLAHAEYVQQTSKFEEELRTLTSKKKQLETPQPKAPIVDPGGRKFRPVVKPAIDYSQYERKEVATTTSVSQQSFLSARTDLKKLVGRWGRLWKLTGEIQGRINRIADDPARPLGEALALLDWTTFENRIGTTEDDEAHLARIVSWGEALVEYRHRLNGDIDMLKTKYRLVLPVIEIWLRRNTDSGRESWEQLISQTNAANAEAVVKLREEIAKLTTKVNDQ